MREATKRGAPIEIEDFERRLRNQEPRRASPGDPLRELARLMQGEANVEAAQRYARIFDSPREPAEEPEADAGFRPAQRRAERQDAARAAVPEREFVPHPGWRDSSPPSEEDLPPPLRGSLHDGHDQYGIAQAREDWARRQAAPAGFSAQRDDEYHPDDIRQAGQYAPTARQDAEHFDALDHAQADEAYASEGPGAYDDFSAEPYVENSGPEAEEGKPGFRVRPWHAVALAAVVGVLGVGWSIARIKGVAGSREIATIAAPAGPTKVAPVADAGASAQKDATVLDRGEETPVRNVVPHQEAPVEPVVESARPAAVQTFRRVKTVAIREDSGLNPTKAPAAVERAANDAPAPDVSTTTPKNAAPPATTAQTAPKPPKRKVAAAPAAPASAEEGASSPQTEAPSSGSSAVQFGAAANEDEARALAKKVAQKYGSRLGGRRPTWKIAQVGDKTVYRVRVGGLSKEFAATLCKGIKDEGGDCYVAGN